MRKTIVMITSAAAFLMAGGAWAKLPAPTPEKAAAAAEAKNKTAWSDKVAAYQLCKAQDKVAGKYLKSDKGSGKKPAETPACADPGPYVPLPPAADAGAAAAAPGAPAAAPAAPAAPPSAQASAPAKK